MAEPETPEEFLQQANVAVISTVDAKGRPHAAPIWYLYEDGVLLMSTGVGSQKHRNIERNPEIALVIDRRTLPYYALTVLGTAELGAGFSDEQRGRLARRYLNEEQAQRYLARPAEGGSVGITLRARKIVEFKGRAGR